MTGWLLDTNVVLELRKPYCDPCVQAWSEAQPATSLHLSTVTLRRCLHPSVGGTVR